jgi:hypothetical protein
MSGETIIAMVATTRLLVVYGFSSLKKDGSCRVPTPDVTSELFKFVYSIIAYFRVTLPNTEKKQHCPTVSIAPFSSIRDTSTGKTKVLVANPCLEFGVRDRES